MLVARDAGQAAQDQIDALKPAAGVNPLTCPGPPFEEVRVWLERITQAVRC